MAERRQSPYSYSVGDGGLRSTPGAFSFHSFSQPLHLYLVSSIGPCSAVASICFLLLKT